MNNLHGWALRGYLPYGGFKWIKNVDGFDVNSINEKSPIVYFLELDPEYPDEVHELHHEYPLAPEKCAVSSDMLLKYCKEIADKYKIKVGNAKKKKKKKNQIWQDRKLPGWNPVYRITWPFEQMVLWDHVTKQNYHTSINTVSMATKRGRMVNYLDGLLAISPITLWPCGFVKPRDKLKQLYLH